MSTVSDTYDPGVVATDVNGDPVTLAGFEAYSVHSATVLAKDYLGRGRGDISTVLWRRVGHPDVIVTAHGNYDEALSEPVDHRSVEEALTYHRQRVAELRPTKGSAA